MVAWWLGDAGPFPSLKFDYFDALERKKGLDPDAIVSRVRKAWAARIADQAR